ncbi:MULTISPECIES: hypothetical protein [Halobacterium]|uniref:Uncharacterized protein n=4 Tax=Halobacterium salinarum TaxID=2242 RepID=A0A510N978_HALSA|nr:MULTISPECIES: hypothetical protein [Halobacterium]MBB6089549.1 hypothetical protein [Halobacterium salinarum]MCF2208212.1 hypothetical protein [Halobacterium salinarum]MCF2242167.1 hypothetical protein [Halobacterium salinarum]MDL0118434.1 hypothetical protein [Halobacterium salinarum]MDL0122540.1 hypothetical protein [Halobacterium salinarum]
MPRARGALDTDSLVKIALALVVVWLAIEVLDALLGALTAALRLARPLIALVIVIVVALWLLDEL